jgi:hypothetical protein
MEFETTGTLTGIQRSKGSGVIEGKHLDWDYTKFHIMSALPTKGDNALGEATQEYRFGTHEEFNKWLHIPLPCVVKVHMSAVTNGKGMQSMEILAIKLSDNQPSRTKPNPPLSVK